jgi:hypothetical protein
MKTFPSPIATREARSGNLRRFLTRLRFLATFELGRSGALAGGLMPEEIVTLLHEA